MPRIEISPSPTTVTEPSVGATPTVSTPAEKPSSNNNINPPKRVQVNEADLAVEIQKALAQKVEKSD